MKLMLISMFMLWHPSGVADIGATSFLGVLPARECRESASNLNAAALSIRQRHDGGRFVYFCTELPDK